MKKTVKTSRRNRSSDAGRGRRKAASESANTTKPEAPLIQRVRSALDHVTDVREKRMFGSTAFLVRGKLCVSARAERIMCRIDPAQHATAITRKGCRTVVMKGKDYQGFIYVAADAIKTERTLKHWIDLALAYNRAATAQSGTF